MSIERIGSLGDAVRPAGDIPDSRGAGNTCCVTGHAGALINASPINGCGGDLNSLGRFSTVPGYIDLTDGLQRIVVNRLRHRIAPITNTVGDCACIEVAQINQKECQDDTQHKENGKTLDKLLIIHAACHAGVLREAIQKSVESNGKFGRPDYTEKFRRGVLIMFTDKVIQRQFRP